MAKPMFIMYHLNHLSLIWMLCFVVGRGALHQLSEGVSQRLQTAFRPKSHRCYTLLFRTFIAFCVFMKVNVCSINCKFVLSFLECLARQDTSVHMLSNYVSAIKPMFIMYHLNYYVLEDPQKYFLKSVHINRQLTFTRRNIMDPFLFIFFFKHKDIQ